MRQIIGIFSENTNFRIIFFANFINRLGDSAETIAYTFLLYMLTGSAAVSAFGLCINLLPTVVIQPLIGPIVENLDHKKMMIFADIIRGIIVICLLGLYVYGDFKYGHLMVAMFLISTVECFRVPAGAAVIPYICNDDEYEIQASMNSIANTAASIAGAVLAGIVLEKLDVSFIFLCDAITFFVSGIIICGLKIKEKSMEEQKQSEERYLSSLKDGIRFFFYDGNLRMLCFLVMINNLLAAPFYALEAPIINGLLHGDVNLLSWISISGALGIIIGSLFYTVALRILGEKKIIVYSVLSYFFLYMGIIGTSKISIYGWRVLIILIIIFLNAYATIWLSLLINASFLKSIKKSMIGRGATIFNSISVICMPVMSALIAVASIILLTETIIYITSGIAVLLAVIVWFKYKERWTGV